MITKKPFNPKTTKRENWYVLCVTPGQEKKIATILKGREIDVYCPVLENTNYSVEGETVITTPLFKSYLFVKISKRNRVLVFNAPGVTRYLFHQGRPARIGDSEIEAIKNWMGDDKIKGIFVSKCSEDMNSPIKNSLLENRQALIEKRYLKLILKDMDLVLHAEVKVRQRKLQVQHLN